MNIEIYIDGGSRGNPGPSAIGAVIMGEGRKKKYASFVGEATNNQAEYLSLLFALKKAKLLFGKEKTKKSEVIVFSDSNLLVKQLNGEYKIKEDKIKNLFIEAWNLKIDFGSAKFVHIPREKNKEADLLVNQSLDSNQSKLF